MRKNIKSEKGITMIILVITIMVLMVLSIQVYMNLKPVTEIKIYENFRVDIANIEMFVEDFYKNSNKLPAVEKYEQDLSMLTEKVKNPNDGDVYYVLDLDEMILESGEKLDISLGKQGFEDYKSGNKTNKDIYVINAETHTIYYLEGVKLDGEKFYTVNEFDEGIKLEVEVYQEDGSPIQEDHLYINEAITVKIVNKADFSSLNEIILEDQEGNVINKNGTLIGDSTADASFIVSENGLYRIRASGIRETEYIEKNIQCRIKNISEGL